MGILYHGRGELQAVESSDQIKDQYQAVVPGESTAARGSHDLSSPAKPPPPPPFRALSTIGEHSK
jgi:hypothetical protein